MHAIPANLFADLGLIFGCTVVLALLFIRIQLPAVLAYLGAGIVLGPSVLGLVERTDYLDVLAEVGVILLLFTVGLEFSLSEIRRSWRAVLVGGGLQVLLTTALATAIGLILDLQYGHSDFFFIHSIMQFLWKRSWPHFSMNL